MTADAVATQQATTVAWSVDGREFRCTGPIGDGLPLGGYVAITPPDGAGRLGQLLDQRVVAAATGRRVEAGGLLVDGVQQPRPFDDAVVTIATDEDVRQALDGGAHALELGSLRGRPAVAASVTAKGFNRHTFLCGQSGSGKTYSLGVLLERLLLHTTLPLLILDPNGDHVHLGRPADGAEAASASAYRAATAGLAVLRATPEDGQLPLRIRLSELDTDGTGAALELDPVADRVEYNELNHLAESVPARSLASVSELVASLREQADPVLRDLALRVENLGMDRMSVWALGQHRTVADTWAEDRPRALVVDTSGFDSRRERAVVAVAVLTQLWKRRNERRPMLLVVDEAHDVCPSEPSDRLQALAVELFTRIAGEGRKYGIHLLLASQRPDKLPDNVLSQCDNLVLMRVNSAADRRDLAERFGFAPPGLVELARTFGLGEALVAGDIARPPVLVRIGTRITPEGGGDVPTDWAAEPTT
jgi:uncharacterized protein